MSDTRSGARLRGWLPRPCVDAVLGHAWRQALGDLLLACLVVALALWPTAFELASVWQENGAYHYAWLVAPTFVYLVGWHYRDQILAQTPQPDAAGVIVAVVAALGWSVAAAANIDIGRQLALLVVIQGLALAALGRRLYRRLLPVMALLFLMLPSGDLLLGPLRWLTVKAVEWFALASGMPFRRDGFLVRVGEHAYIVLEACAGLAHVTLTLFLGYCFALLVYRSMGRIVALALGAAALGVVSNVVRVDTIVWIDQVRGFQMDLAAHGRVQWIALLGVLALLFYGMTRLRAQAEFGVDPADPAPPRTAPATRVRPPGALTRHAPVAAGLAVLVIVGLTRVVLDEETDAFAAAPERVTPAVLAGWERELPATGWADAGDLRSLAQRYRASGRELDVALVEARVAGAKLTPQPVFPDRRSGWLDVAREPLQVCPGAGHGPPGGCVQLVHALWRNDDARIVRHVYYGYSIGSFQTNSTLLARLATAAARLGGQGAEAHLMALSVDGDTLEPATLYAIYSAVDAAMRDAGR